MVQLALVVLWLTNGPAMGSLVNLTLPNTLPDTLCSEGSTENKVLTRIANYNIGCELTMFSSFSLVNIQKSFASLNILNIQSTAADRKNLI